MVKRAQRPCAEGANVSRQPSDRRRMRAEHPCPIAPARALVPSCLRAYVPSSLNHDPVPWRPKECAILLCSGGVWHFGTPARAKSTKSTPQKHEILDTLGARAEKNALRSLMVAVRIALRIRAT
jgi:hypothetical protein